MPTALVGSRLAVFGPRLENYATVELFTDSARIVTSPMPAGLDGQVVVRVTATLHGTVVYTDLGRVSLLSIKHDGTASTTELRTGGWDIGWTDEAFWALDFTPPPGGLVKIAPDGARTRTDLDLALSGSVIGGNRLGPVVNVPDANAVFGFNADGSPRALAEGQGQAGGNGWAIVRRCDLDLECSVNLIDTNSGESVPLIPNAGPGAALEVIAVDVHNGQLLARHDDRDEQGQRTTRSLLIAIPGGNRIELDDKLHEFAKPTGSGAVAFDPSGRYLLRGVAQEIRIADLHTGEITTLDVGVPTMVIVPLSDAE